jgi:hypothetical protein
MLGGFAHVSRIDLQGSRGFLAKLGVIAGPGPGPAAAAAARRRRRAREGGDGHAVDGGDVKTKRIARAVDCGAG